MFKSALITFFHAQACTAPALVQLGHLKDASFLASRAHLLQDLDDHAAKLKTRFLKRLTPVWKNRIKKKHQI